MTRKGTQLRTDDEIVIPELEEAVRCNPNRYHVWTEREVAILKRYYGRARTADIAKHLKLTVAQVLRKAQEMGIRQCDRVDAQ